MGFKYIPATIGLIGALTLSPLYSFANEERKGPEENSVTENIREEVIRAGNLKDIYSVNFNPEIFSKENYRYGNDLIQEPTSFRDSLALEMILGEGSKIELGLVGKFKISDKVPKSLGIKNPGKNYSYGLPVGARLRKKLDNGTEISLEAHPTVDGISNFGIIIGGENKI